MAIAQALGALPLGSLFTCLSMPSDPSLLDFGIGPDQLAAPVDELPPALAATVVHGNADALAERFVSVVASMQSAGLVDLAASAQVGSPYMITLRTAIAKDPKGRWPACAIRDLEGAGSDEEATAAAVLFADVTNAHRVRYDHTDDAPTDAGTSTARLQALVAAFPSPSPALCLAASEYWGMTPFAVLRAAFVHAPVRNTAPASADSAKPSAAGNNKAGSKELGDAAVFGDFEREPIEASQAGGRAVKMPASQAAAASDQPPPESGAAATPARAPGSRRLRIGGEVSVAAFLRIVPQLRESASTPAVHQVLKDLGHAITNTDAPCLRSQMHLCIAVEAAIRSGHVPASVPDDTLVASVKRLLGLQRAAGSLAETQAPSPVFEFDGDAADGAKPPCQETLTAGGLLRHAAGQTFRSLMFTPEARFTPLLGAGALADVSREDRQVARQEAFDAGAVRIGHSAARVGAGVVASRIAAASLQRVRFGDRPSAAAADLESSGDLKGFEADRYAGVYTAVRGLERAFEATRALVRRSPGIDARLDASWPPALEAGCQPPALSEDGIVANAPPLNTLFTAGGDLSCTWGEASGGAADEPDAAVSAPPPELERIPAALWERGGARPSGIRRAPAPQAVPPLPVASATPMALPEALRKRLRDLDLALPTGSRQHRTERQPCATSCLTPIDRLVTAIHAANGNVVLADGPDDSYALPVADLDPSQADALRVALRQLPPPLSRLAAQAPAPRGVSRDAGRDDDACADVADRNSWIDAVPIASAATTKASECSDIALMRVASRGAGAAATEAQLQPRRPQKHFNRSAMRDVDGCLNKELLSAVAARLYDEALWCPGASFAELHEAVAGRAIVSELDARRCLRTLIAAGAVTQSVGPAGQPVFAATGPFVDPYELTDL
jgi:hypothetical protein